MSPLTFISTFKSPVVLLLILLSLTRTTRALSFAMAENEKAEKSGVIVGNSTIYSENKTFVMGFFAISETESKWYLSIKYAAIPAPTYVWVANREKPITDVTNSTFLITERGTLAVRDSLGSVLWESGNDKVEVKGSSFSLLDSGNLVLFSDEGSVIWQSFDHPTDTWLPGMNLTAIVNLTSWKSLFDPSPGLYSLRLRPRFYNEFELVYNGSSVYWSTGNWTGGSFANIPEMTVHYIYKFYFLYPYLPTATFGYTAELVDTLQRPVLTGFRLDSGGQIQQYTWTLQSEIWQKLWSQPDDRCKVYNLCGGFGFCQSQPAIKACSCFDGFRPKDSFGWDSGDYSNGCVREGEDLCKENDEFEKVGVATYSGAESVLSNVNRRSCEKSCLNNCSCIGLSHNERTNVCKNLYGTLLNWRNLTSLGMDGDVLYVRVQKRGSVKKNISGTMVLVGSIVGSLATLVLTVVLLLILHNQRKKQKKGVDEDGAFLMLNLKVFSYKELHLVTKGFSEKLGHGGFGAVFQGELSDSTSVAVKRLDRPGGGEKEFRAEVCTIGNVQHVNLVRLRGFCSENSHRLLVYDYMPNGPLSAYLHQDSPNLSWEVRFQIAVGTARGIAYLHEECRDCIIHCDIKPENILLDVDYTAKVSDFGLARLIDRDFSRVVATMRGTWGYVAPEWISGLPITAKADVYSYGMTLLELMGGRRNVEAPAARCNANGRGGAGGGVEYEDKWFFPPWAAQHIINGNVAAVLDNRLGGAYKVEEVERAALVAIWCIQDNEEMRPTMGMVVKMLEGTVEVTTPPPPRLIQALVSGESYHGAQINSASGVSGTGDTRITNEGYHSSSGDISSPVNENVNVSIGKPIGKTDQS